ncbi:esterase E4-like isoform X2 [Planococcus citri]|uniref:esterase E4-like isoform X2 n=1 Tax=Planococcus citri TaxID=170843 RepID=UPI0031F97F61
MFGKVIVTVKEGNILGFKRKTYYSGVEFYTFLGVPYGQSTAGSARFELPSEGEPLKAVMVNVHPGGLFHGSPDPSYFGNPGYIMHKDVVYVCLAYRLYILGALNLHMENCSGNQGLKDAILSLEWIKDNISAFGGDPNNITLMGSSSGAALVHAILLSPLAKGLFHKAILMGMYAFSPVMITPRDHVSIAYDLAIKLGYDGEPTNHEKLLDFFKNVDYNRVLMIKREQLFGDITTDVFPVSVFATTPELRESSPLPASLEKLIPWTNRVPIMIGFCEKEACMTLLRHEDFKKSISTAFGKIIQQNSWGWGAFLDDCELKLVQKEVDAFYLAGKSIETASLTVLCDILTDAAMSDVYGSLINVLSEDHLSPVYVYNFLYDGELDPMKARINARLQTELKGTCHAADYGYWHHYEELVCRDMCNLRPNDRRTIDTLTSLLTSFAKTSNPNYEEMEVEWKPTTLAHPSHLIIDEKLEVRDQLLNGERMQFWHSLKNKFQKNYKNV